MRAAVASRLGVPPGTEFVHLERLRLADGEPLALDRTWLVAALARPLLEADLTETGVYAELARSGVRITDGQERIRAVTPTPEQRRRLRLGAGAALLAIERIGRVQAEPVEWRETLVRGDRFTLVATWAPHRGYELQVSGEPVPPSP